MTIAEGNKKIKKIASLAAIAFAIVSMFIAGRDIASMNWSREVQQKLVGPGEKDGLYVVLFRGSSYCPTCDIMERLTGDLINSPNSPFADEVARAVISFKVINYELPGNDHYLFDYDIYTTSIVLIEQHDGLVARWENLQSSWEKSEDGNSYNRYLIEKIEEFRKEGSA